MAVIGTRWTDGIISQNKPLWKHGGYFFCLDISHRDINMLRNEILTKEESGMFLDFQDFVDYLSFVLDVAMMVVPAIVSIASFVILIFTLDLTWLCMAIAGVVFTFVGCSIVGNEVDKYEKENGPLDDIE